jgi:hypothetical protein
MNAALEHAAESVQHAIAPLDTVSRRALAEGLEDDEHEFMRSLGTALRLNLGPSPRTGALALRRTFGWAQRNPQEARVLANELDDAEPLWLAVADGLRAVARAGAERRLT